MKNVWMVIIATLMASCVNSKTTDHELKKTSVGAEEALGSARENTMIAGVYYDIEVGLVGGLLWLAIDGNRVFEAKDPGSLVGGHLALRIRGTAGFKAGCLIKDLEIAASAE